MKEQGRVALPRNLAERQLGPTCPQPVTPRFLSRISCISRLTAVALLDSRKHFSESLIFLDKAEGDRFNRINRRRFMFLALLILVGSGLYVFLRRKVQVSSSFAIQGRSAQQIGVVLILGGLLSDLVPTLLDKAGLVTGMMSGLILAITIMFASLICTAVIAVREKRRQRRATAEPPPGDNTKA